MIKGKDEMIKIYEITIHLLKENRDILSYSGQADKIIPVGNLMIVTDINFYCTASGVARGIMILLSDDHALHVELAGAYYVKQGTLFILERVEFVLPDELRWGDIDENL